VHILLLKLADTVPWTIPTKNNRSIEFILFLKKLQRFIPVQMIYEENEFSQVRKEIEKKM
jgi:hypothetical protein